MERKKKKKVQYSLSSFEFVTLLWLHRFFKEHLVRGRFLLAWQRALIGLGKCSNCWKGSPPFQKLPCRVFCRISKTVLMQQHYQAAPAFSAEPTHCVINALDTVTILLTMIQISLFLESINVVYDYLLPVNPQQRKTQITNLLILTVFMG